MDNRHPFIRDFKEAWFEELTLIAADHETGETILVWMDGQVIRRSIWFLKTNLWALPLLMQVPIYKLIQKKKKISAFNCSYREEVATNSITAGSLPCTLNTEEFFELYFQALVFMAFFFALSFLLVSFSIVPFPPGHVSIILLLLKAISTDYRMDSLDDSWLFNKIGNRFVNNYNQQMEESARTSEQLLN